MRLNVYIQCACTHFYDGPFTEFPCCVEQVGIHDLALACPLWQFGSNHNRVSISILAIGGEQTGCRRRGEHRKAQIRLIRNLYLNNSAIPHSYHLLHQILPKSRFGNTIGRCITECVWQTLRINSSEQRTLEDSSASKIDQH